MIYLPKLVWSAMLSKSQVLCDVIFCHVIACSRAKVAMQAQPQPTGIMRLGVDITGIMHRGSGKDFKSGADITVARKHEVMATSMPMSCQCFAGLIVVQDLVCLARFS